jgi:serine/threonine-protein kinase
MDADDELRARAAARIGSVLRGKYRVDSVLGIGGMAVVYAATHRNKKRFAIKLLHPELSLRGDIRQRFLREGHAANSLEHPAAVAILDEDVAEDGAAFLVMELLQGASAETLWDACGRRMPADVVLTIARELLELLAVAHGKSIVHRDIKPANLFVTRDGAVKVLDFGIARVMDVAGDRSKTNTGTMLGTPAYMSPEQAGGLPSEIDGRTDVWGVGATMFTMLCGEHVHLGETPTQVAILAATRPARSLASVVPDAPAPLVEVVDRALAFAKADRWESAAAMRDAVMRAEKALFAAGEARTPLAALVEEHAKAESSRAETAPTMGESSDPQLAPTLPQQSTPAFTPASPLARSTAAPVPATATTGGHVSESQARSEGSRPSARRSRVALGVVLGLAAVATAGILAVRASGTHATTPAATQAPAAPQTAPAAANSAPVLARVALGIAPSDAVVEIDGKPAAVTAGAVTVEGTPGSMHMVRVSSGGHAGTYPVLVTEGGAVPASVELVAPASPASGASAAPTAHRPTVKVGTVPAPSHRAPTEPTATASQSSVSRTME